MTSIHLRPDLDSLPAYKPGRAPAPTDGRTVHKLSSNENPFPPLDSVLKVIAGELGSINRYPEMAGRELTASIAARYDVPSDNIVLGSGSVEIVSQLIRATASAGDEIIYAWRSFEAYPLLVIAAGAKGVGVPLDPDHRHDLDAMAAAITDRTRLILVCNPNNPTGTIISAEELDRFMQKVPPHVVVVVDEAYEHFNTDTSSPVGIEFFRRYSNVVVSHTFSKAYGLAGLRVGYAIAPADVATALRKVALPFGVTSLAQAAARASLDAEEELQVRVDVLVAERERLFTALRATGLQLPDSQANFIWFPLGDETARAAEVFEEHGVISRAFPGSGFRVSIGDRDANDAILRAAREVASWTSTTSAG